MASESFKRIEAALNRFDDFLIKNNLGKVEYLPAVPLPDLRAAEDVLKMALPEDYVEFVAKKRFVVDGNLLLLTPEESLRMMESEVENFTPEVFGATDEQKQEALAEHELRRRLYPFQYTSNFVHDLYCFYLDQESELGFRIVHVYRDDTELSKWVPKSKGEDGEYSFTQHIETLVDAFIGDK